MQDRAQPQPAEPRELADEFLELIVGGAGNPAPELMQRLLREGLVPPSSSPVRT